MSVIERRPIFQAVKQLRGGKPFTMADVRLLDAAIDEAMGHALAEVQPAERTVGPRGIKLIQSFEGCKLEAYPDPGTGGEPWTIGWGSTGPGIAKGVRWTQAQADERFLRDVNEKYGSAVDRMLGDSPTTQSQFDALTSLAYNIGTGALQKSTVLRKHKAGDYAGAAQAFLMWNRAGGKVMRGLTRRRLAESDLYDDDGVPT